MTAAPQAPMHAPDRLSRLGKIVAMVLLIVVFEGAIRKWVSAGTTGALVGSRDLLALYGVAWAFGSRRLRLVGLGAQVLALWSFIVFSWGLLQLIDLRGSLTIFAVGLRFWLLYLWFAYVAGMLLTATDFRFLARLTLGLTVFMAPLAVLQFLLPPGAFLNRQLGGDEETVFRVTAEIVRTTGTFSFTAGYSTFVAFAAPFALSLLVPTDRIVAGNGKRLFFFVTLVICTVVSGSRTAFMFLGLLMSVYAIWYLLVARGARKAYVFIAIPVIGFIFSVVFNAFSRAIDAIQERFQSAAEAEVLGERIVTMFFGEKGIYENFAYLGRGIGMGTNVAGAVATGDRKFLLAETEVARTILEGGVIGLVLIGLKLGLITYGLRRATRIMRETGEALPFLLWFTTAIALMTWPILGQLTINAFGMLLFGLALASLRLYSGGRAQRV